MCGVCGVWVCGVCGVCGVCEVCAHLVNILAELDVCELLPPDRGPDGAHLNQTDLQCSHPQVI